MVRWSNHGILGYPCCFGESLEDCSGFTEMHVPRLSGMTNRTILFPYQNPQYQSQNNVQSQNRNESRDHEHLKHLQCLVGLIIQSHASKYNINLPCRKTFVSYHEYVPVSFLLFVGKFQFHVFLPVHMRCRLYAHSRRHPTFLTPEIRPFSGCRTCRISPRRTLKIEFSHCRTLRIPLLFSMGTTIINGKIAAISNTIRRDCP